MKRIFLLCVLIGLQTIVKAQKVYFIYLQSENATPFYIRIGGQIQSSSTEGYLIVPNLRDSTYQVSIGQPGKQAEPRFSITVNKADRGFLIRAAEGTINLFDLQTLAVYKPISAETSSTKAVIRTDNFTRLLALVADDSSLLIEPTIAVAVTKEQRALPKEMKPDVAVVREVVTPAPDIQKPPETANPTGEGVVTTSPPKPENKDSGAEKKETVAENKVAVIEKPAVEEKPVKSDTALLVANKPAPTSEEEPYKKSVVTKKSESSTSDGFGLIFLDQSDGVVDTIQLLIPNPVFAMPDSMQKEVADTKKFLDISAVSDSNKVTQSQQSEKLSPKAQCAALATDDDFFKLRRDMTAKTSDDEMIAQAKRYFKVKCYRTEQIKYLTALFLTEESKYQFFDAAYMHVSDQDKFKFLQAELKDSYYINRFKALIAN
jgi:hypothetical protein